MGVGDSLIPAPGLQRKGKREETLGPVRKLSPSDRGEKPNRRKGENGSH